MSIFLVVEIAVFHVVREVLVIVGPEAQSMRCSAGKRIVVVGIEALRVVAIMRLGEQVRDWEHGVEKSSLLKHSLLFHGGQSFDFGVRILQKCYGRPSRRLITEAVLNNELTEAETMNSKREWSFVELDKVSVA